MVGAHQRTSCLHSTSNRAFAQGSEAFSAALGIALRESQTALLLGWTFASQMACNAQPRNQVVEEAIGEVYAARARAQAVELNRSGDFGGAESVLTGVAEKIATYAAESPALKRAVLVLYQSAVETSVPMSPVALKAMHFRAGASLRERTLAGTARRRPETS
jgi:hypothetical protein